ncbi:sensor histidine kinase [Vibrio fluvialis]|uniref:sensor histidine kinase n=1 Tax=Vibrio fluvialis TaxID=676 RepID=UPI001F2085A1|nr:sensor histidine kinase KdpD [Vibrio fluvialis]MCE7625166.1 sensor histidine kinase KdpD [Vibrio fluvialis]
MVDDSPRTQQANALLNKVKRDEKGKLTIFLGAAPGVGKTYAMLNAAKERLQQGIDVVVGYAETHGREDTQQMLDELEVLPRRAILYNGNKLDEFDLDLALERKPELILVDELAHTNVPGSRHKRRYQDIEDLLSAGIDVYTTVNIQHLDSLNDLVRQITGVKVRETVPDYFVDDVYDIRFIDLSPVDLVSRLQQGKVYLPEYARLALDSFFSLSNLAALRELAMKKAIEQVDYNLTNELESKAEKVDYVIKDKLLVLVSTNSDHRYLIRMARQIAERRQVPWTVLWVDHGRPLTVKQRHWLNAITSTTNELGANFEVLRSPSTYRAVVEFLSENKFNTVLLGYGAARSFQLGWKKKRLYQRLVESGLPVEVSVFREPSAAPQVIESLSIRSPFGDKKGYSLGFLATSLATLISIPAQNLLNSGNLVLLFVFGVLAVGLKHGARPAIVTSIASFMSFNFFLTDPYYSFKVNSNDDIFTLIFLIVVSFICGPVASRVRDQFILLKESNRYTDALKELAQALSVADDENALWRSLSQHIARSLSVRAHIVLRSKEHRYQYFPPIDSPLKHNEIAAIDWTFQHNKMAGQFTDTLNAAQVSVVPIPDGENTIGTVVIYWEDTRMEFNLYERELLNTMLQQAINTWQRIRLVSDLESARVKTEVEQIRSALLSSVSHDLKSPLSAMMGAAESLRDLNDRLSEHDRFELLDTILQESHRLDSYIQNLLDMTKLGHGKLKIERDWVSSEDIISSVIHRIRRYFPSVNLVYTHQSEPPILFVHAALIEQALFNILENAVRYSPELEPISVTLKADESQCMIAIEDRGPGIPKDQQEQIFNMFYVVSDGDKKKNNTGMGLAICKGMISAHGGKIRAMDGSHGLGTRFEVSLPLEYKALNKH